MKKILIILLLQFVGLSLAQGFTAYQFYDKKGQKISPENMAKALSVYDIVFFGEYHNNSINHWLQLKLTQSLFDLKNGQLTLGSEMFERDNQKGLNQYLEGKIDAKNLKDSVRLWNNYKTDYQPLLNFAKDKKLDFIATNIPRRYASQVSKQGIESLNLLTKEDKVNIASLPIVVTLDTPGYQEMKAMMGDHADVSKVMNFVSAQAIKDATMAESILQSLKNNHLFLHYNGDFHTKKYGGIYWYIKQKNPNLKMAVISVFESEDPNLPTPEKDFIPTEFNLVVPTDITKTF